MPHGGTHLTGAAEARGRSPTPAPQARPASTARQTFGDFLADIGAGLTGKPLPGLGRARARQGALLQQQKLAMDRMELASGILSQVQVAIQNAPVEERSKVAESFANSAILRPFPFIGEAIILSAQPDNLEAMTDLSMLIAGNDPEIANVLVGLGGIEEITAFGKDNAALIQDRLRTKHQGTGTAKLRALIPEYIRAVEARGEDPTKIPLSVSGVRGFIASLRQKAGSAPVQDRGGVAQQEAPDAALPTLTEMHVMFNLAPQATQAIFNEFGLTTDESFNAAALARAKDKSPAQIETEAAAAKRGTETEEVVPFLLADGLSIEPMSRRVGRERGLTEATLSSQTSFDPETGAFTTQQGFLGKLDSPTVRKLMNKRNQLSTIIFQVGRLKAVVSKHGDAVLGVSGGLNRLFDTAVTQTKTIVQQAFGKSVGSTTADGTEVNLNNFQFTGEFANQSAEVKSRVLQLGFALAVLNNDGSRPSDADFRASMQSFNFDTVGQMFSALDSIIENSAFRVEIAFKNAGFDDNLNIREDVQPFLDRLTESDVFQAIDEEVKTLRSRGAFTPLTPEAITAGERAVKNPFLLDLIPELRQ